MLAEFGSWSSSRQSRVLVDSPTPTPLRRSCASLREKDRMQILESLRMRSTTTPVQVCNSLKYPRDNRWVLDLCLSRVIFIFLMVNKLNRRCGLRLVRK